MKEPLRRIERIEELLRALDDGLAVRRKNLSDGSRLLNQLLFCPQPRLLRPFEQTDPLSPEYLRAQLELYRLIAGNAYHSSHEGHETPVTSEGIRTAQPFYLQPSQIGYWLMVYGHVLDRLELQSGQSVLEVGYGPGGLTEFLVRAGLEVTGVEVRESNARFLHKRIECFGGRVNTITGDIATISLSSKFDAVVFFESFHHMLDPFVVLRKVVSSLKGGGKLLFCAEPIVNDDSPYVPYPWGLRMSGDALGALRDVGWVEFGFRKKFFIDLLNRLGMEVEHSYLQRGTSSGDTDGYHHSSIYLARSKRVRQHEFCGPEAANVLVQTDDQFGGSDAEPTQRLIAAAEPPIPTQLTVGGSVKVNSRAEALRQKLWRGHDPFASFPKRLVAVDVQGWNSDHQYLKEAVPCQQPSVIVDLGVWKGGSTITMARRMKELALNSFVIAVDTWLGAWDHWLQEQWFHELSFDHGYPRLFYKFIANVIDAGLEEFVLPLPLDSVNAYHVLRKLSVSIDVAHIDGGHDYETVSSDLRHWWELLTPNGVLIVDDYFVDGKTWPEVRAATDDFLRVVPHSEFEYRDGKCRAKKVVEPEVKPVAAPALTAAGQNETKNDSSVAGRVRSKTIALEEIGICMILYNEEHFIQRCIRPLIPCFSFFTILDMDSTDRTVEIVKDLLGEKAHLVRYSTLELFRKGYAEARNLTIAASSSPWLLHLDADEVIVSGLERGYIDFGELPHMPPLAFVERRNLTRAAATVRNDLSAPLGPTEILSTEFHGRLHQRRADIRWRGYIHEEIWVGDAPGYNHGPKINVCLEHYSELRPHHERQLKNERYSWMLLNGLSSAELQQGTNKYWYETFVPSRLNELESSARRFAERERLALPELPLRSASLSEQKPG